MLCCYFKNFTVEMIATVEGMKRKDEEEEGRKEEEGHPTAAHRF